MNEFSNQLSEIVELAPSDPLDNSDIDTSGKTTPKLSKKRILSIALAVFFGLLILVFAIKEFNQIQETLQKLTAGQFFILLILGIIPCVFRAESWHESCVAAGARAPRSVMYSSAATSYVAQAFVAAVGVVIRIFMLRKIAPSLVPKISTLIAAEAPVVILECLVFIPIFCFSLFFMGYPFWIPFVALLGAVGVFFLVRHLRNRFEHHAWADGLHALKANHHFKRLLFCVIVVIILSVLRTWLSLEFLGVESSFFQASVAVGVLSVLTLANMGIAATPSAMIVVFGKDGVETAATVGLLAAGIGIISALIVAVFSSLWAVLVWKKHKARNIQENQTPEESLDHS